MTTTFPVFVFRFSQAGDLPSHARRYHINGRFACRVDRPRVQTA
jgi:hypothetical protein